jgi:hypothetical protein
MPMERFCLFNRRKFLALAAAVAATRSPVRALVIVPTFESSVTTLPYATQLEDAFNYAAQQYEALYSNPITVNLAVAASNTADFLGDTDPSFEDVTYGSLRSAFLATAASTGQPDQNTAATNNWPSTDPTGIGNDWYVPSAEAKALGLLAGNNSANDGTITFGTGFSYSFDPFDRAVPGEYDFIGTAEHEIGHALGRAALMGMPDSISNPAYAPLDLYRFMGPGTLGLTSNTGVYFSIDNGNTNLVDFAPGDTDNSDWSSPFPDSYNADVGDDVANTLTPVDITVNGVLGYDETPSSLTWNGGTADFLVGNGWSSSTQSAVNPHHGVSLTVNGGNASHSLTTGENFALSDVTSDVGTSMTINNGTVSIGVSGSAGTNGFGFLVNQDGSLTVQGNGTLDVAGPLSIGDGSGVTNATALFTGNAIVQAGTVTGTTQVLYVGNKGAGSVSQTGSARVNTPSLILGNAAGSSGLYQINGSGAVLTVNGNAYLGGSSSAAGGSGLLSVEAGQVTITGTLQIWNTSLSGLVISGGAAIAGNTVNLGAIIQSGGTSSLGAVSGSGALSVGNSSGASASMTVTALTQSSVTVDSTGSLTMAGGASSNTINQLTIDTSGKFDITNGHFFINYSGNTDPVLTIRGYLASGYNAGAWNGAGIDSSTAATNSHYGIGYADGADHIVSGLSSGQIEVKYTLYGDANLDGVVNGTDFGILAAHFGDQATAWDAGDFNYDGVVNGSDFGVLASNFGQQAGGAAVALPAGDWTALDSFAAANGLMADVPEPAAMGLATLGAMGVLTHRLRNKTSMNAGQALPANMRISLRGNLELGKVD